MTEQQQAGQPPVVQPQVYWSRTSNLRVGFPPDRFGWFVTDEELTDEHGTPVVVNGVPVMKKKPHASVKFGQKGEAPGRLTVSDAGVIERLSRHPSNGVDFFPESKEVGETQRVMDGEVILTAPADLTEEDRILIGKMAVYEKKSPPTKTVVLIQIRADFSTILERFDVKGLAIPPAERGVRLLRNRIVEFLYALEPLGLWRPTIKAEATEGEDDGRGNIESGETTGE